MTLATSSAHVAGTSARVAGLFNASSTRCALLQSAGFASPKMEQQETDDWGNEDHVCSRLSTHASLIDLRRQVLQGRFESVDRFCTDFWQSDPEMRALDVVLAPDQRSVLRAQLRRLIADGNIATDGRLVLELSYLLTVAHKR